MADNKRSRLASLLKGRKQRQKASTTTRRLKSESLEDRVLLAADLTFSPSSLYATAYTDNQFEFNTLDFLPGNLLVKDLGGLSVGDSTTLLYQARLGLFVDSDGNPLGGTGLNTPGGYEITAVIEADVKLSAVSGSVSVTDGSSTGSMPSEMEITLDSSGSAVIELYIDSAMDANNLGGTGFNNGTRFMSADLFELTTEVRVLDDGAGNALMGLLDQFNIDNFAGQQTFRSSGSTTADGDVKSVDPAFVINPINIFQFELIDVDSTTSTAFQQADPSMQFEGIGGSTPYVPDLGLFNAAPDGQFQADSSASFLLSDGEIHGRKFHDLNANGIDDSEPGLAGVTINLAGLDRDGNAISLTTTTDSEGKYSFVDLPEGVYTVSVVAPSGSIISTPNDLVVDLESDERVTGIDFGCYSLGTIHGVKFHDLDEDGVQDAGEPPMSGVSFVLQGTQTDGASYGPVTLTSDGSGEFWSDGLKPGSYTVTETVPAGYQSTTNASQSFDVVSGFDNSADPALFGNAVAPVLGSIHGFKCEDLEADGGCSPPVIHEDAHIVFVVDYSGSTKEMISATQTVLEVEIDAIEATLNSFAAAGVQPEVGIVAFNESALQIDVDPAPGIQLFNTDAAEIVAAMRATTQADVYNDGDPGPQSSLTGGPNGPLTNYGIALDSAADLLSQWNVDPEAGNVVFISDGVPTVGDTGSNLQDEVDAVKAHADTLRAFGFNTANLANLLPIDPMAQVYSDPSMLLDIFSFLNGGGEINNPGLPGITFQLVDADGNIVDTTTTDDNGEFWFTDVALGTYTVQEVLSDHFYATTHHETMLTIGSGQEYVWKSGAAKLSDVAGRHIFYNDSAWDGNGVAVTSADDNAIATDKVAYVSGGGVAADFSNYTSFHRGINGVMVDIDRGMSSSGTVTLADFDFRWAPTVKPSGSTIDDNDATTWGPAPAPTMVTWSLGGGVERYAFSWPDGTLKNGWLQVITKANATTGLPMDDIHYWGNAVGETGNMLGDTMVNAADASGMVSNPVNVATVPSSAAITNVYDVNRDMLVNAADVSVVQSNPANGLVIQDLHLLNDPSQQTMGSWKKEVLVGNDLIFGNARRTASIHGFKFEDDAVDGIYDPLTEPPMPDVEFGLYDTNDNPILDDDGNPIVAVSDASGQFWFDNLALDTTSATTTYRVKEHGHTNPNVAGDVYASTDDWIDVVLKPGEEAVWQLGAATLGPNEFETLNEGLIFGNYVTASLHGMKFKDNDMDGFYDASIDEPWQGWTFLLQSDHDGDGEYGAYEDVNGNGILDPGEDLDGDGLISGDADCTEVTQVVTSNADGEFWFEDLCPCHYRLLEVNPFSDVYPTPMTDADGDGEPDTDSKMTMLYLQSGDEAVWKPGAAMLPADTLKEEAFYDGPGTLEKAGNGIWDALTFGNFAFGSIHGFKYQDANVDGQYDPADGDTPLGGVAFELEAPDGTITSGYSNPDGEFWFTDLKPGEYKVREILDHGLWNTTPLERTVTVSAGEEHVWADGAANLPSDSGKVEVLADLAFGNAISGSIHGFKFNDYDGDGVYEPDSDPDPSDGRDQNDHPWEGFVFEIIGDTDGDGTVESGIFLTTDANGEFWIRDLYPGEYIVRERLDKYIPAGHQDDFVPTTHPLAEVDGQTVSQYTVTVGSGEEWAWAEGRAMLEPHELQQEKVDSKLAFGNSLLGSVHGCVYNDANGNGVMDNGESVQGGVEVQLTNTDTGETWTEVTWLDGLFWFDHDPSVLGSSSVRILPGNYDLTAINLPTGWAVTTSNSFYIGSGEEIVHEEGAAHLVPAADPQHEVIIPSAVLIGVMPPAPAFLPGELETPKTLVQPLTLDPIAPAPELSQPRDVQILEASLLSFVEDRDSRRIGIEATDDEDLIDLLASDRWFL